MDGRVNERTADLKPPPPLYRRQVFDDDDPEHYDTFRVWFEGTSKEDAIQNQYEFFIQRFGGPPLFSERKGHPALRARHARFGIESKCVVTLSRARARVCVWGVGVGVGVFSWTFKGVWVIAMHKQSDSMLCMRSRQVLTHVHNNTIDRLFLCLTQRPQQGRRSGGSTTWALPWTTSV